MARRGGSADLPLHGGRVPPWLASRMAALGRVICEAIILEYGRDALLSRLAHPFWFQSFGAVMGMDWHSSGITTSVIGALKRGLAPVANELGLAVCGGRGKQSRKTPDELFGYGERWGIDGVELARSSRLVAKVDSAAVQDGFQIYLHGFIVAKDGSWVVVQQGMNGAKKTARRYHWRSAGLDSFVDAPHAAIEGENAGEIVNLTDVRAARSREAQLALLDRGPDHVVNTLARLQGQSPLQPSLPHLQLPAHHDVTASDVVLRRVHGALAAAAARGPVDFADLLLTPGVGARTVWSLAMVAEVIHGTPSRFSDPARFSLAHGGKDGHPYPVPLDVFDRTISVLRRAVDRASLDGDDRMAAIRRLDATSRRLEVVTGAESATSGGAPRPSLDQLIDGERRASPRYGGMTVHGPARAPQRPGRQAAKRAAPKRSPRRMKKKGQLSLSL